MLHTNITSFFLGSMNHVRAEAKTDAFGCQLRQAFAN